MSCPGPPDVGRRGRGARAAPSPSGRPGQEDSCAPRPPRDLKAECGNAAGHPHDPAWFPETPGGRRSLGEPPGGPPDGWAGPDGAHGDEGATLTQDPLRPRLGTTRPPGVARGGGCEPPCPAEAPAADGGPTATRQPGAPGALSPSPVAEPTAPRAQRALREGAAPSPARLTPRPPGLRGGEVAPSGALAPCGSHGPRQGHISGAQGPSVARRTPWAAPLRAPSLHALARPLLPR